MQYFHNRRPVRDWEIIDLLNQFLAYGLEARTPSCLVFDAETWSTCGIMIARVHRSVLRTENIDNKGHIVTRDPIAIINNLLDDGIQIIIRRLDVVITITIKCPPGDLGIC